MGTIAIIVILLFIAGLVSYFAGRVQLAFLLLGFVVSLVAFGLAQ